MHEDAKSFLISACLSAFVVNVCLIDRPEPARLDAGLALGALFRIDVGDLALFPLERAGRAGLEALAALLAFVLVHHELDERRADPGRAAVLLDMRLVLVAEILDRRKHRVGRGLAQTAERGVLDLLGKIEQKLDIAFAAFAVRDARAGW